MMMDTAIQQQTDPNGQTLITPIERQSLIQKLNLKWPLDLSTRIENQAFEKSKGIKLHYFRFIQGYYQQVQTVIQNRTNQQQQQQQRPINPNVTYPNSQTNLPQQPSVPIVVQPQHQLAHMPNQSSHYPAVQQQPRMMNPQQGVLNQMTRLREPQKFNQLPINTISYPSSPPTTTITTIDLSQSHSSPQMNGMNSNDYASLQPRYPIQPARQRPIHPNGNIQQSNNPNDILQQYVVGNSLTMPILSSTNTINSNNSLTGDQVLQRMLLSNNDGGSNKMQNRQSTPSVMSQLPRSASTMNSNTNNSTNPLRTSLSSQQLSPSVVIMPTPAQTSTVQIQPSNNIIIQHSPLNNGNGALSVNSQTVSMNSSTPLSNNYSSPINRTLSSSGNGHISSPDDEIINLIKYLKENVNRLQPLLQKFTNEGNTEKVRQVHAIHQQIIQFINNPTNETLSTAKHFRDMLDRIPNRTQLTNIPPSTTTTTMDPVGTNPPPPVPTNIFNQCSKTTIEFLLRDQKERIGVMKRYLEPLSDVINGVPHKMMRLDVDNCSTIKIPSYNQSSLLSNLTDELNQLPADTFSIERISVSRSIRTNDNNDEYLSKTGIVLRCKLLEKFNPIIPPLRLHLTTRYPEQSPDILSLTKAMPPRLEFSDGHPFFDQISSVFVSHLFKLRPQHTVTDILNIWRQSVQTAL